MPLVVVVVVIIIIIIIINCRELEVWRWDVLYWQNVYVNFRTKRSFCSGDEVGNTK
jgi:hypothetical protein